jgi:Subtilase family
MGVIILASASNQGANHPITFPARLKNIVFCIGAADGKGNPAAFNPPFIGEEKYSALGEAVLGAVPGNQYRRKDGTSTATPIAAGIAAVLIDFTRQFMDMPKGPDIYQTMRKLFIKMSEATVEQSYRYLAPWYLINPEQDSRKVIKAICENPVGMSISYPALIPAFDRRWNGISILGASSGISAGGND